MMYITRILISIVVAGCIGIGYVSAQVQIPDALVTSTAKIGLTGAQSDVLDHNKLSVNGSYPILQSCNTVPFYVAFELGGVGSDTQVAWTVSLSIKLKKNNVYLWSQAKVLTINSTDQLVLSAVFHDTPLSCATDYALEVASSGNVPAGVVLTVKRFDIQQGTFQVNQSFGSFSCTASSVAWTYGGPAVGYDLEWVFIGENEGITIPASSQWSTVFNREKEPVRVTVKESNYTPLNFYPKGWLLYRIRAVGIDAASPDHRINGAWRYAASAVRVENPEANRNWQLQTSYAEDGKFKKVVTYFDGTLRDRQAVTNLSSSTVPYSLVAESFYDFEGRKVVNTLPAPTGSSSLSYSRFNVFAGEDGASGRKALYDNGTSANSAMLTSSGAGAYYSPRTDVAALKEDYLPDAEGYVYSQVEYVNDGSGRISRQSGVGKEFALDGAGTPRTTRYFYGSALQEELNRLFGANVGLANHYKKNMVIDPNGQASISYLDQQGRVIATSLAGSAPEDMLPLESNTGSGTILVDLDAKNVKANGSSTTVHTLLNLVPTSYTFTYSMSALGSQLTTYGCADCSYDLRIYIHKGDGTLVNLSSAPLPGNQSPKSDTYYERFGLTATGCASATSLLDIVFTVNLPDPGEYRVVKVVTPRELTVAQVKTVIRSSTAYVNMADQVRREYSVNPANCAICETCDGKSLIDQAVVEIGDRDCDNLYQRIVQECAERGILISQHEEFCVYNNCVEDKSSTQFERNLARVQNWTEASKTGYTAPHPMSLDPFFTSGNGSASATRTAMSNKLQAITIRGALYATSPNTKPTQPFPAGSISVITDPASTAYWIVSNGTRDALNGFHVLYYDLYARHKAGEITAATLAQEVDKQRWALFRMFYLEAKREIKLTLPKYISPACAQASVELNQINNLPTTPAEIDAFGEENGVITNTAGGSVFSPTGKVNAEALDYAFQVIQSECGSLSSEKAAIVAYLKAYFDSKPANFLWRLDKADFNATPRDPNLNQIETILAGKGCSLAAIVTDDPLQPCTTVRTISGNLIQNPFLKKSSDTCAAGMDGQSACYPGWRINEIHTPRKVVDQTGIVKNQSVEIIRGDVLETALTGTFISPLVPGTPYKLCFKYRPSVPTSTTDVVKIQLSRAFNSSSPILPNPDQVIINGVQTSVLWSVSAPANSANYIEVCVQFTPQSASTYFHIIVGTGTPPLGFRFLIKDIVVSKSTDVSVLSNQISLCTSEPQGAFYTSTTLISDAVAKCMERAQEQVNQLVEYALDRMVEEQATLFLRERTKCLDNLNEAFTVSYAENEYHYTLYYYDQSDNLVQTVPPKGVNRTTQEHTLVTRYYYNSLNQLIEQKTPDAGISRFYYNTKGQLRASQNAEQGKDNRFSYSRYDALGRITEVGEINHAEPIGALRLSIEDPTFPQSGTLDVVSTVYDVPKAGYTQSHVRNRVSYVEVQEKGRTAQEAIGSYYSYDIHGNVRSITQRIADMEKRVDYRYDLISGNVNYVFYQSRVNGVEQPDQFIHWYQYDADNRLLEVYTSTDGYVWDKDARYEYYRHGPLARVVLGEYNVQGMDYYYTLQGWIKGVNMPYAGDPGKDGVAGTRFLFGKDVFAYALGYYENDYKPVGENAVSVNTRDKLWTAFSDRPENYKGLYNGNIAWMETELTKIGEQKGSAVKGMQAMVYFYDQLNRIRQSRSLTTYTYVSPDNAGFTPRTLSGAQQAYDENFSYDPNGNLLTLTRAGETGAIMDQFNYEYYANSNKLRFTKPVTATQTISGVIKTDNKLYESITVTGTATVPSGSNAELKALKQIVLQRGFDTRGSTNETLRAYAIGDDEGIYNYDAIGNLIADQEIGTKITWTPYGKVRTVSHGDGTLVSFRYDGSGNRVEKKVEKAGVTTITRYVRDASGNVMAVYNGTTGTTLAELPIYGSARLGAYYGGRSKATRKLGGKKYELTNHLGNVLAVITDNVGRTPTSTFATVVNTTDYYAFGSEMSGRSYQANSNGYRYGFNGKEKDDNGEWGGTAYDYGLRIYNPSIGRFLSVDPLAKEYPWNSTYAFAENDVIRSIDLEGAEKYVKTYSYSVSEGKTVVKVTDDVWTCKTDFCLFDDVTYKQVAARNAITYQRNPKPGNGTFTYFEFAPELGKANYARYNYTDANGKQQVQYFSQADMQFRFDEIMTAEQNVRATIHVTAAAANLIAAGWLVKAELKAASGELKAMAESANFAKPSEFYRLESLGKAEQTQVDNIASTFTKQQGWGDVPAVKVFEIPNGSKYILDGHHRFAAGKKAGVDIKYETVPESQLKNYGYNSSHEVISAATEVGPDKIR